MKLSNDKVVFSLLNQASIAIRQQGPLSAGQQKVVDRYLAVMEHAMRPAIIEYGVENRKADSTGSLPDFEFNFCRNIATLQASSEECARSSLLRIMDGVEAHLEALGFTNVQMSLSTDPDARDQTTQTVIETKLLVSMPQEKPI